MKITVLSNTIDTVPTAKGSYQKLELAFKGEDGQVKGKKIMSFGAAAAAFKVLAKAQAGETYEITAVKNEGTGYWDWTNATKSTSGGLDSAPVATDDKRGVTSSAARTSTYETAEERAKRQVYIVRQSSLSSAIAYSAQDSGSDFSVQDVINVAKQFEAYVFDTGSAPVAEEFVGDEDQVL